MGRNKIEEIAKRAGKDWVRLAGDRLEDANCHSVAGLPEQLYEEIKRLVKEEDHSKLGFLIYDCFRNVD